VPAARAALAFEFQTGVPVRPALHTSVPFRYATNPSSYCTFSVRAARLPISEPLTVNGMRM